MILSAAVSRLRSTGCRDRNPNGSGSIEELPDERAIVTTFAWVDKDSMSEFGQMD
jgi:hypothetical protein